MTKEAFSIRRERGIALVLTLATLVIATILVVGFVASMRTERQAAKSLANNGTAGLIGQAAINHAISILDRNIPQLVPPGGSTANPTNWIINPGLLTTTQGTTAPVQIPLSSNPSITYSSTAQDAELNVPQLSGSGYTILPTSASMRVAWIPVLKDPSTIGSATNQIVGRYGFWIDDESAKVNINTAVGKPNILDFTKLTPGTIAVNADTYPLGHPSSVNLDLFGTINTGNLANAVALQGGLTSIDAIKSYVPNGTADSFLNSNKFFLTAFSRDPEFNVFGKSRLYLFRRIIDSTGNILHQVGRPLFQVFRDLDAPMYFHGDEAASADTAAPYYTAKSITSVLARNDWPGMPARSFVDKWGGNAVAQREADQVAWNMISMGSFSDYGTTYTNATSGAYTTFRNTIATGQPGYPGTVNYPNAAVTIGPLSQKAIVPAFPRPVINEVCLTILLEANPVAGVTKYRLKVWLQTELWLGPGYPDCDFGATAEEVGLTYLSYSVWQDNNPNATQAAPVAQEDTKYIKSSAADLDGIRSLFGSKTSGIMSSSSPYSVVITQGAAGNPSPTNKWIYVRNGSGFSSSPNGMFNFEPTGILHLDFKMRLFEHSPTPPAGTTTPAAPPCTLIPIWDARDPATSAVTTWDPAPPASPKVPAFAPPTDDPKDYIEFQFDLDPAMLGSQQVTRSLEVADPRVGGLARMWKQAPGFTSFTTAQADTLGAPNSIATGWDTKKLAFVDFPAGTAAGSSYRPPVGMFSVIPTGMQRGLAGSTLKLQPSSSSADLPDWLLLDLLAPSVDASNYANLSFMNSTSGKVNLNATISPTTGTFNPPQRWQPLQAVFQNMSASATVASGATAPSSVVNSVLSHTLASGGIDFGAPGAYDYPGEVCEIAGVADDVTVPDWTKEQIVRYIASNLTTKSNVFSVWGVAQTVKKNPANNNAAKQGVFETKAGGAAADDTVTGEKRFEAIVERYVWPGTDNISGNGNVSGAGSYNQLSATRTLPGQPPPYAGGAWEKLDGPDTFPSAFTYPVNAASGTWNQNTPYGNTSIDTAVNPLRAQMKYRIIYFKYLTD